MMTTPMMTCEEVDDALLEYLEATLDGATRARVDDHVSGCLRCSSLLRDIAGIRSGAAQLPDVAPSRDLWPAIAARIESPVVPLVARPGRPVRRTWIPVAAAAAATLVIATAGITYFATSRALAPSAATVAAATQRPATVAQSSPVPQAAPVVAEAVTSPSTAAGQPSATAAVASRSPEQRAPAGASRIASLASRRAAGSSRSGDVAYGDEIARLQTIISDRRRDLDPATITVIEQSLAIIDAAVQQSRAALARDPRSGFLADQLNHALDKKVELLRTVALLPSRT